MGEVITRGCIRSLDRRAILLSIVVLTCMAACGGGKPSPSAAAVAMVNDEAVSLTEFQQSLSEETALAGRKTPLNVAEMEGLKTAVLDNLIRDKLMLQRARALSLSVGEAELTARIEEIRKDYNDQFGKMFGDGGVDYSAWREALRNRMLFEKLVAVDVNAGIQVTDQEAERYFDANRKAYATHRRVRVSQIVVPDRERAEGVLKRLKAGEDFAMVAKEVSIGPEAVRGGDLGYFEQGVMPEAIDRMVFSLPVGKMSSVVQSPYGFHVFKVLGQEGAGGRNFADVRDKVIADLRKQEEADAYRGWIDGLRAKAEIRINRPLPGGPPPVQPEMKDVRLPAVSEKH